MKVIGEIQVEIDEKELGSALWQKIQEMMGKDFDDAGCDWYTDNEGNTYISSIDWKVSDNPILASLVNSANFLTYGKMYKIDSTGRRMQKSGGKYAL